MEEKTTSELIVACYMNEENQSERERERKKREERIMTSSFSYLERENINFWLMAFFRQKTTIFT